MMESESYALAENFIKFSTNNEPTYEHISEGLMKAVHHYDPTQWDELHFSVVLWLRKKGWSDLSIDMYGLEYPDRELKLEEFNNLELRKVTDVSQTDHDELVRFISDKQDLAVLAAVEVMREVGCKVSELQSLTHWSNNEILFKEESGYVKFKKVSDESYYKVSSSMTVLNPGGLGLLDESYIVSIQEKLRRYVMEFWPDRDEYISLYSYEYRDNGFEYIRDHDDRVFKMIEPKLESQRTEVLRKALRLCLDDNSYSDDELTDMINGVVFQSENILDQYLARGYFGLRSEDITPHQCIIYQVETVRMALELIENK